MIKPPKAASENKCRKRTLNISFFMSRSIKTSKTKSESFKEKVTEESTEKLPTVTYSQPSASVVVSYDRDLIRMIAEVAFINGEVSSCVAQCSML